MNDQDYELLSQYMDGELDVFSARKLEQRLSAEPQLQATLQQLTAVDTSIKSAFSGTDQAPAHVSALVQNSTSNLVAFPSSKRPAAWQYAVAASLVAAAGLLLTPDWQQSGTHDALLSAALESTPSMASGWADLEDGRQLRPVLSFKDNNGQWCREFLLTDNSDNTRGVACRNADNWATQVLAATTAPTSNTEYRPAGAADSDEVASYMALNAADIPLSITSEAELINSEWKQQ